MFYIRFSKATTVTPPGVLHVPGGCKTLWGECEQAACISVTEERMKYAKLLTITKVTIAIATF